MLLTGYANSEQYKLILKLDFNGVGNCLGQHRFIRDRPIECIILDYNNQEDVYDE